MKNDSKVTWSEKVGYVLVNLGNVPVMSIIGAYLLMFYTDVVGLNPASVATLFIIARFADALNDPFIGFLLDRFPVTKMGRFRPVLMVSSVICGLNYLLLWYGPLMVTTGKLTIVYITYLLLGVTFTVMDISLNSLLPVMTADQKQRNSLSSLKGTTMMLGAMVVMVIAPIIISAADAVTGYMNMIAVMTAIIILCSVIGSFAIKEHVIKEPGQSYSLKDLLVIIRQKPVVAAFLLALFYSLGSNSVNAAGTFFYTYIFGDLTYLGITSGISMLGLIPGLIISAFLANKFGKKKIYMSGFGIAALGMIIKLFAIRNVPLLMAATVLTGFGTGFIMSLMYGIQADNTDYVEHATGKRAEAAVASLSSFVIKVGSGIGGAIPGYILAMVGYIPKAASQTNGVNMAIILMVTALPAALYIIGMIVFGFTYPLDEKRLDELSS